MLCVVPKDEKIKVIGSYPIRGMVRVSYKDVKGFAYSRYLKILTNSTIGKNIAEEANKVIGCKYVYGSAGPTTYDYIGLIYYCHNKAGVKVPRRAYEIPYSRVIIDLGFVQVGDIFMKKPLEYILLFRLK